MLSLRSALSLTVLALILAPQFSWSAEVSSTEAPTDAFTEASSTETSSAEVFSSPTELLRLDPIPPAASNAVAGPLAPDPEMVCEIDPLRVRPRPGATLWLKPGRALNWRKASFPPPVPLAAGVHWFAGFLDCARYGHYEWKVEGPGETTLFVDGEETSAGKVTLRRGNHRVLLRVEADGDSTSIRLALGGSDLEDLSWTLSPHRVPACYERIRQVSRYASLAVAPQGRFIARVLSRRKARGEGRVRILSILSRQGVVTTSLLPGESARPLFFTPRGREVLLQRRGSDGGADLVFWPVNGGTPRVLLRGEPHLSLVRSTRDGRSLLIVSRGGAKEEEDAPDDPIHQAELRKSVPDYQPGDVLHLVDASSGARRRLTAPGECVIEDAVFLPGAREILYVRTLPIEKRPWFASEFRLLDLTTGDDSLLTRFVAGWEVRPDDLALSPDGSRVAFTGPPEELGEGHGEHNVYNRSLYVLELDGGDFHRVHLKEGWSFNAVHDLGVLAWFDQQTLFAAVDAGSSQRLVRLLEGAKGEWRARVLPHDGDHLEALALSADHAVAVYAVSSREKPSRLRLMDFHQQREIELESPNDSLPWTPVEPQDASFRGPHGETIDAWWYAPAAFTGEGPAPLIVNYYGGASPTLRRFNTTHQWWCANGYAVLVINPRGAYGYGDAFADCHAGDWGPMASADILQGVETFLRDHPEIDAHHVGIYGGSYGGFMTAYLLTRTKRFAAAVDLYGISDITSYWGEGSWGVTYGDMSTAGERPWDGRKLFVDRSPVYNADAIETPLLLLHGLADDNVPPGESRQLFTALCIQDRPVEMVLFPGENHGIAGSFSVFVQQRAMMLDWFDRWLKEEPEAWDDRWKRGE